MSPFTEQQLADLNARRPVWHIECSNCHRRMYYDDIVQVTHNGGFDWADGSSFCPFCDDDMTTSVMHDGPLPKSMRPR